MITPVQSNINNTQSFGSLNVERIRVPRKQNDSLSFAGNPVSGGAKKGTGIFKKGFEAVKKAFSNVIHSKFVQGTKENVKKFFKGAVDFVRSIPKRISGLFKKFKKDKKV